MVATSSSLATGTQDRPLAGIAWALSAGFILSVMDGLIKWSVGILPVAQVVVIRSAFVLLLMAPMIMRAGGFAAVRTRRPLAHLLRVALTVTSILTFFEALRFLPLATVIAIGFGAPLLMTAISVPVLGERVGAHRWTAIAVGFVGVLIITRPGPEGLSWPALLALVSSALFATHLVAARFLARTETDTALMFWQNLGVFVVSAALAPFFWVPIALADLAGIAAMATLLLCGQFATVRAFRTAPVGVVAPFQYVELLWAALIGYAFWSEVPAANVWVGAAIVVASGLYVIWRERRLARPLAETTPSRQRNLCGGRALPLLRINEGAVTMDLRVLQFLAIVFVALALAPGGAHLFALPNKIGLPQDQYFTVQGIYRGWALLGIVLFGALAACLALTVALRRRRLPFLLALTAFFLVAATLVIFFAWTYPANQATANWTMVPANWAELRAQWEYSHAVNAVLTFLALCAVTLSTLVERASPGARR